MLISFIVTSYNYAEYISETIESIKKQTYEDIEIIVVDDFSTDNSVEILEQTDDIKLIKHSQNKGQLAAIISGLKETNGEYISIIDSDDTIESEFAKTLVEELTKNNVALVTCNSNKDTLLNLQNAPFGGWWWSPMSCGMIKKEFLKCILEYKNANLWKICPDKFLFNLAHLQGNSLLIKEHLVNKREHAKNAGKTKQRFWINLKNNLLIRQEALNIIKNEKLKKEIIKSYSYIPIKVFNSIKAHF